MAPPLVLQVRSRGRLVYDGEITSLSSENETGKFDVLSQHSNFISLVNAKLVARGITGEVQEIPVKTGILKVKDNKITVFLGIGSLFGKKNGELEPNEVR